MNGCLQAPPPQNATLFCIRLIAVTHFWQFAHLITKQTTLAEKVGGGRESRTPCSFHNIALKELCRGD